ncbi:MAG: type IV pilin protein [Candidatus Weimeria sp.]
MMKKKKNKGFTLLELIIVVAIIGILVAILTPSYIEYVNKSRFAANKANAQSALSAAKIEFINVPAEDLSISLKKDIKSTTPSIHLYFRYDAETGDCKYVGYGTRSPNNVDGFTYRYFANIGYASKGGAGNPHPASWTEVTKAKRSDEQMIDLVLARRTYRYWDVAMQGDGSVTAIMCLW